MCPLLACVPTMFLPENIRGTENVYWSIRGLMTLLDETFKSDCNTTPLIAVPCMGTGVGHLSAEESAIQVNRAINSHKIKLQYSPRRQRE